MCYILAVEVQGIAQKHLRGGHVPLTFALSAIFPLASKQKHVSQTLPQHMLGEL